MAKFLQQDKKSLKDPGAAIGKLLARADDDELILATTEVFDLEEGEEQQFLEGLANVRREFDRVVSLLTAELGAPAFNGDHKSKKFPVWATLGYHVAFWKQKKRLVYVHVSHVGSVAPVSLSLGVVTGPPKDWLAGA